MPDSEKYVSYKQAFTGMIALAGILITLGLAIWGHEQNQNRKIEKNSSEIKEVRQKLDSLKEDIKEIKTMLKTQISLGTDTRERVIRIEEKIKN